MAKLKTEKVETTYREALGQAESIVSDLASELRDWAGNMSGTALENTPKYEDVDQCASDLEDLESTIQQLELPEELVGLPLTYYWKRPYGRHIGRAYRAGEAGSALRGLVEDIQSRLEDKEDGSLKQELGEVDANAFEDAADEIDNIDFPGMY